MHAQVTEVRRARRLFRVNSEWTLREHEAVITYWPDREMIRHVLPHRSIRSIAKFAARCNLTKSLHIWTAAQDGTLRKRVKDGVPRKQIASELGMTVEQVGNRMHYAEIRYGRRRPKPSGVKIMDSIRLRAFVLNLSPSELDEACHSGRYFRSWSPARHVVIKHVLKAVKVLDGELSIEWSPTTDEEPRLKLASKVGADRPLGDVSLICESVKPLQLAAA